jgi:hypothetical protein
VAAQHLAVRRGEVRQCVGVGVIGRPAARDYMPFLRILADDDPGLAPHEGRIGRIGEMARLQRRAEAQALGPGKRIEPGARSFRRLHGRRAAR